MDLISPMTSSCYKANVCFSEIILLELLTFDTMQYSCLLDTHPSLGFQDIMLPWLFFRLFASSPTSFPLPQNSKCFGDQRLSLLLSSHLSDLI